MSLLNGIRFIPKNERKEEEIKSNKKEIKSNKKRKHKKDKKKKKDKYQSSSSSSSSSSEDDNDNRSNKRRKDKDKKEKRKEVEIFNAIEEEKFMKEIADEEELLLQNEKNKKIKKDYEDNYFYDDYEKEEENNNENKQDDEVKNGNENNDSFNNYNDDYNPISTTITPNNEQEDDKSKSNTSTNQGMASLLRARFKNPKSSSSSSSNQTQNFDSNNNYNQDNNYDASLNLSFMTKEERKWMSAYTRRTSDKLNNKNNDNNSDNNNDNNNSRKESLRFDDDQNDDIDAIIASNIIKKGSNFLGTELGLSSVSMSRDGVGSNGDRAGRDEGDENGDGEIDMKMLTSKKTKLNDDERAKLILSKAEKVRKLHSQITDNCSRCRTSKFYRSHRTICTGMYLELRIKQVTYSLNPEWHCELVPITHMSSILKCLDNNTMDPEDGQNLLKELERFKSCLSIMFERLGQGVIFMETAIHSNISNNSSSNNSSNSGDSGSVYTSFNINETQRIPKYHTIIEVLPFELGLENDIYMSFYQSFQTSGEEYSTHQKQIFQINTNKKLQKLIPNSFPYIAVEWSTISKVTNDIQIEGIAHIVEDKQYYSNNYCIDVISGVLDIDPFILRKLKNKKNNNTNQNNSNDEMIEKQHVENFRKSWSLYDWTEYNIE